MAKKTQFEKKLRVLNVVALKRHDFHLAIRANRSEIGAIEATRVATLVSAICFL
jgi:hypothetical protein